MRRASLPVVLAAALVLGACTEDRAPALAGVEATIHQAPAHTQPVAVTTADKPAAKKGTGSIALSLRLPDRTVLATVDDVARVTITLRSEEPGAVGAIGTQEVQREQLLGRTATLRFSELVAGHYGIDVTAWDADGANIGSVSDHVQVDEGMVATLSLRLQLVDGHPPGPSRPSPLPSGPDGQLLPSLPPPATPRPIDAPTPVPVPSATATVPIVVLPSPTPVPTPTPTAAPSVAPHLDYNQIFTDGVNRQLAYPLQQGLLPAAIAALSPADHASLDTDLAAAKSETEQIFILKALAAGEQWSLVSGYADDIRGMSDTDLIARSMMHAGLDLVQQWQDSCGPSIVEVAGGEYDPRYAFELHKLYQVSVVDPFGVNKTLADQQKQWLEQYGGVAVPRGQTGGKAIGITNLLDDKLAPITHATYTAVDATANPAGAFETMANDLAAGYAVPLRVVFVAEQYGHFIVALAVRGAQGQHDFLIHDSVSGKTAWVSQANILAQNFNVFFNEPVALSHYYQPTAR